MICTSCGLDVPEEDFVVGAKVKGKQYKYWRACVKKYREAHNRNNPLYQKEWYQERKKRGHFQQRRLKQFGITQEELDQLFEFQGRKCAICQSSESGPRDWHIDHDHLFGEVRGLLCHSCNTSLGGFQDSLSVVKSAYEYLKHPTMEKMKECL
jgi:hypothetical protein